jgi:hypothetical protein
MRLLTVDATLTIVKYHCIFKFLTVTKPHIDMMNLEKYAMTVTSTARNQPEIGIVTVAEDLHAYAIRQAMQDRHQITCHIIETDRLADSGKISWATTGNIPPTLPTLGGGVVDVSQLDLVWWRRPAGISWHESTAVSPLGVTDPAAIEVILNDCRASFQGIMLTAFQGVWISPVEASRQMESKLLQLQLAQQVGLSVPATLVSQNPQAIRQFCAERDLQVAIKPLSGISKVAISTTVVSKELLQADRSLQLSPAIYQELLLGQRHLRIHAFGADFHTALITCEALDWRYDLSNSTVESYQLPAKTQSQLREFMRLSGLRMGIFDMKLGANDEPIWLEVNPQGQFLFVEGLSDLKLADTFADFLYHEATAQSQTIEAPR